MIKVYDSDMNLQATLQNAYAISYEKRLNEVWAAEFTLPADDPKNEECLPFRFIEIFDAGERVDLFRILPNKYRANSDSKTITYSCEQVLSTLLDDLLFRYHQTTNLSPAATIQYILDKQTAKRWSLGIIEFTDIYSYAWENTNLLSALFSIPKTHSGMYMWTWDTTVYPWRLNLVVPPSEQTSEIRYRKNLIGIEKDEDPRYVITRLYPLGYGEGVNQLGIESVNSGIPYIDADTAAQYGIISANFVDKTEENPLNLLAKAQTELEKAKIPQVTYSIDAADLYQITQDSIDRFREPGSLVKVYDEELGIFTARLVAVRKPDIKGKPGDIQIEISTKKEDIADITINLLNRQRISEVNAQGATNIDSNDYQDNCDNAHPAVIKFYIPEETVRVNKCLLNYETDYFRAYERATKGGGATTETTDSGGSHRHKMFDMEASQYYSEPPTDVGWHLFMASMSATSTQDAGVILPGDDYDLYTRDAAGTHSHDIEIPNHTHEIEYGIYEYDYKPSKLTIKVDGNTVSTAASLTGSKIDIIPYLSKDASGRINRGTFHTVEITPNTTEDNLEGLARITASVIKQTFLQSRGGGDY